MSESPWNVKSKGRRMQTPISPQGAQVKHVPHHPPSGERPRARRMKQHAPKPAPQPIKQQAAEALQPEKQTPRKKVSFFSLVMLGILLVATAVSAIMYTNSKNKFEQLQAQRQAQAERLLAHKMEHLNARTNSGYWEDIQKYAKEYGLNPSFVAAVIKCESSFKSDAVSRVDARGLMQLMPGTAQDIARQLNITNYQPDMLFDPVVNIRMGTYYLSGLSNKFQGNPVMVVAAYHAGDTSVRQWALRIADDKKTISLDQIPMDDTRSYVRKVMDAYAIYYEQDQGLAPAAFNSMPDTLWGAGAEY